MNGSPTQCRWCEKPAFAEISGADGEEQPICIDHYIRLQSVENERQRNLSDQVRQSMAMANLAMDEMRSMTGMPGVGARIAVPIPTPAGSYSSISVSNSTIGVLSTATVGQISAFVGAMPRDAAARSALEQLTETVANASISELEKKNLSDQIAVVAEQAATAPERQKPSVVAPILSAITQAAGTTTAVAGAWKVVEPILKAHFNLP